MPLYPDNCKDREPCEEFEGGSAGGDCRTPFRKDYGRIIHSACFRRLQGKTQLFPGIESDFFRNRLTHSLEVAQVAKGIAIHLNHSWSQFKEVDNSIDYDLVELSALAHDLGHPPFGHNGEAALHEIMKNDYGFEGNAQTLRILSTLEKKYLKEGAEEQLSGPSKDNRLGLNLTYRSIASILKYDKEIPKESDGKDPVKGYYSYDSYLVDKMKRIVSDGKQYSAPFKTLECYIMDIADDIAYSTYDLEDSLKAGFINILDILGPKRELLKLVAEKVEKNMKKVGVNQSYNESQVLKIYLNLFNQVAELDDYMGSTLPDQSASFIINAAYLYDELTQLGESSHLRTNLTSKLINRFINGVWLENYDNETPALSKVSLTKEIREEVEVLKNLVFVSQIESNRLKVSEYRGKEIVHEIFEALFIKPNGHKLMPDDFQTIFRNFSSDQSYQKRIVVDFIAGMTDKYAIEFYGRLKSENPQTIFKPL